MKKVLLLLVIGMLFLSMASGPKKTVIRDSKGRVIYVKETTKDGYTLRDARGRLISKETKK